MIECNSSKNQEYFDKIHSLIKSNCHAAELVKIEKQENTVMLFFKINFEKIENVKALLANLEKDFKEIKFSLYENKILD